MNDLIMFIDDDPSITRLFELSFGEKFQIQLYNCEDDLFNSSNIDKAAVIISDYHLGQTNGIDVLKKVKDSFPDIRRILLSGKLDLDIAISGLNNADIHRIIEKPWNVDELILVIQEQIKIHRTRQQQKEEEKSIRNNISKTENVTYDLIMNLKTGGELLKQIIKAVDGISSLINLHFQSYNINNSLQHVNNIESLLLDIELIANQFRQYGLLIYTNFLKACINIYRRQFDEANKFYKGSLFYCNWLGDKLLSTNITSIIEKYPFDHSSSLTQLSNKMYKSKIKTLISLIQEIIDIHIEDLIIFSDDILETVDEISNKIMYIVVIRDELLIFDYNNTRTQIDLNLISNFISALSQFLAELVLKDVDIHVINHGGGAILFHNVNEIKYVVLTKEDDIRLRIGLKQLASESVDLLKSVPKNTYINEIDYNKMKNYCQTILGIIEKN